MLCLISRVCVRSSLEALSAVFQIRSNPVSCKPCAQYPGIKQTAARNPYGQLGRDLLRLCNISRARRQRTSGFVPSSSAGHCMDIPGTPRTRIVLACRQPTSPRTLRAHSRPADTVMFTLTLLLFPSFNLSRLTTSGTCSCIVCGSS